MIVNSGRIVYDGRTAFKYSADSRKTLTVSSKLEDMTGSGNQYKFQLGVSHPYTTVDLQTEAQITRTDDKLAAEVDIKYLTARRQTKNIALMTEIDRLKRQLNLKVSKLYDMPMTSKSILAFICSHIFSVCQCYSLQQVATVVLMFMGSLVNIELFSFYII